MKSHCRHCFITVSDPSRIFIVEFLKKIKREITVSEVVGELSLRQPTVTFHINKLVDIGLIRKRKRGREVLLKLQKYSPKCSYCPIFN